MNPVEAGFYSLSAANNGATALNWQALQEEKSLKIMQKGRSRPLVTHAFQLAFTRVSCMCNLTARRYQEAIKVLNVMLVL